MSPGMNESSTRIMRIVATARSTGRRRLVLIIGLFDLLNTANTALTDANWQGFAAEAYIFTAAIYFCFCFFMSRYSQMLERTFDRGHRR